MSLRRTVSLMGHISSQASFLCCPAVGFDVRRECIQMGRDSVRQLVANSPE